MCSPTLAITAVSAVYGAYSQMQNANAQAKAIQVEASNNQKLGEYNAKVAEVNADINNRAAKDAIGRGAQDAARVRENTRKLNARGRAMMASTGLLADTGNNLDVVADNTAQGEINALTVFNNAEREAYGYKIAETDDLAQAQNLRYQGKLGLSTAGYKASVVKQNGLYDATGTLVTGAGNFGKLGGFDKQTYKDGWKWK